MIKSMTGYGRGECTKYSRKFVVEIKSVNHRYNDISIRMPRVMAALEEDVRKAVAAVVLRGKSDVFVNYESLSDADVSIKFNEALADGYMKALESIKDRYSLDESITLSHLIRFPDIISIDKNIDENKVMEEISETLMEAVSLAADSITSMRAKEGEALSADIVSKLGEIKGMVNVIELKAPAVSENYRQKLTERLSEALNGAPIDETRLLTEIAIFTDKSCIDEEITRLTSHIEQMGKILAAGGVIGRKLDFLVQEMNREANTIGSKASDLLITQIVVDLKSEIEKIREQVQNIE